jgi:hypothetical protein
VCRKTITDTKCLSGFERYGLLVHYIEIVSRLLIQAKFPLHLLVVRCIWSDPTFLFQYAPMRLGASVLNDTDLSWTQTPGLEHESGLLAFQHGAGFLSRNRSLEHRLVDVGVKLLPSRIEFRNPVTSQSLQQFRSSHLNSREKSSETSVLSGNGLGNVFQGGREDIDGPKEIGSETLNGKVPCRDLLRLASSLQVDEVCLAIGQLRLGMELREISLGQHATADEGSYLELLDLSLQFLNLLRHLLSSALDFISGLVNFLCFRVRRSTVPSLGDNGSSSSSYGPAGGSGRDGSSDRS